MATKIKKERKGKGNAILFNEFTIYLEAKQINKNPEQYRTLRVKLFLRIQTIAT